MALWVYWSKHFSTNYNRVRNSFNCVVKLILDMAHHLSFPVSMETVLLGVGGVMKNLRDEKLENKLSL